MAEGGYGLHDAAKRETDTAPSGASARRRPGVFAISLALTVATVAFAALLAVNHVGGIFGQLALERANARISPGQLVAEHSQLDWNWVSWRLEIEFEDIRYEVTPGNTLLEAQGARLVLALEELTGWRTSLDEVSILGLTVTVDASSDGGPFLVAGDSSVRLPLRGLLNAAADPESGSLPRIEVHDGALALNVGNGLAPWRFRKISADLVMGAMGGTAEIAASPDEGTVDDWIEIRADWGADLPPEIAVSFDGISAHRAASVLAGQAVPLETLQGLAASGTAQIGLDAEFGIRTAEGEVAFFPDPALTPDRSAVVDHASMMFHYEAPGRTFQVSGLDIESGWGRADGNMAFRIEAGQPISAWGVLAVDVRESPVGEFEGSIEVDADLAAERVRLPYLQFEFAQGEVSGRAEIEDFDLAEDGVSARALNVEWTMKPFGDTARTEAEGAAAAQEFSYAGDMGYDWRTRKLGIAAATILNEGREVRLQDISYPFADPSGGVSGRLFADRLSSHQVAALWPSGLVQGARSWFADNVEGGEFGVDLQIRGTPARVEFTGLLAYADAAFRPSSGRPWIRGASGRGELLGDRLRIDLERGFMEGRNQEVRLTRGLFELLILPGQPFRAAVEVTGEGSAPDVLHAAWMMKPDAVPKFLRGEAANGGRMTLEVRFAISLETPDVVGDWEVSTEVRGVALSTGESGPAFDDLHLEARFGPNFGEANGEFHTGGGLRVTFDARRPESNAAAGDAPGWQVTGALEVPESLLPMVGSESLAYRLHASEQEGELQWAAHLRLDPVGLAAGQALLKSASEAGSVSASGTAGETGFSVSRVALDLPYLRFDGALVALPNGGWKLPLEGEVGVTALQGLGFPVLGEKQLPVRVSVSDVPGNPTAIEVYVDLTAVRVDVPASGLGVLGVREEAGPDAHIAVTGTLDDGRFLLRGYSGAVGGITLSGMRVEDSEDDASERWHAEVRIGDASRFDLEISGIGEESIHAVIVGDVLDISGEIQPGGSPAGESATGEPREDAAKQVVLRVHVRRLQVTRDLWLEDAVGRVVMQGDGSVAGSLSGLAFGSIGAEVLVGQEAGRALQFVLTLDDAGATLNTLGITSRTEGGRLRVTPLNREKDGALPAYRVQASGLQVSDAPLIGQLMAFISGIGLIEYVLTGNLTMDSLAVNVTEDGNFLRLADGSVQSASIAVAFAGSYDLVNDEVEIYGYSTPLNFVNRVLTELPIIGHVVKGPGGTGIIGVGFSIRGPSKDPEVTSSPLDFLLPILPQLRFQEAETEAESRVSQ